MAAETPRVRFAVRRLRALVHDASRPRRQLEVRRGLRDVRRRYPGLTTDISDRARTGARHVLVVSLTDDAEQIRLETILAKAIQAHGGRVTVLTYRTAPWARLFGALGVTDVVHYEDLAPAPSDLDPAVLAGLDACRTVADYKAFEVEGARIGRQALSSVVRASREPRVDLDDPAVRAAIRRTVRYAVESVHVADRALARVAPDCLLMLERGYAGLGSIFDRALVQGVPVIQFQSAHRDDAFYLKRYSLDAREFHARSLDDSTWERLLRQGLTDERERELERELASQEEGRWFLSRRTRHSKTGRDPAELRAHLGLDADRKVAVLFSHILWDASMFYGRDLYPDQGRWFAETIRLAAADDRVQWLVKLHPALFWKLRFDGSDEEPAELAMIREAVGELPAHMRLLRPDDDVANPDLFRITDVGVTIRGTVGIELPPLGVPVITAGTSDYSGKGFTIDADTVAGYETNLRAIPELDRLTAEQVQLARLYAYGIFCVRPWRFESFALDYLPVDEAGDSLKHHLRYNVGTLEELGRAPDLALFARWVLDSDAADFVDEQALADVQTVGA
jgi:hypothetical protein